MRCAVRHILCRQGSVFLLQRGRRVRWTRDESNGKQELRDRAARKRRLYRDCLRGQYRQANDEICELFRSKSMDPVAKRRMGHGSVALIGTIARCAV
jgi:hypothetical protein